MNETKAAPLSNYQAVLYSNEAVTIFESQQEFEGEQGTVVPAKSIWFNKYHAEKLRDFLNEVYPIKEK